MQFVKRAELRKGSTGSIESEQKAKGGDVSDGSLSSRSRTSDPQQQQRLEYAALFELSMKRLKQWIEEDDDKRTDAEREVLQEKMREAKISHDNFVRLKDR